MGVPAGSVRWRQSQVLPARASTVSVVSMLLLVFTHLFYHHFLLTTDLVFMGLETRTKQTRLTSNLDNTLSPNQG